MVNPNTAYYALVTNLVNRVRAGHIERLGIDIGFNSWTHGAAMIRENEQKKGYNIPCAWSSTKRRRFSTTWTT